MSSIQMTFSLELELEDEDEPELGLEEQPEPLLGPLLGQMSVAGMLLLSDTKDGGTCTSVFEAATGPIEGPSSWSSLASIGGTYDDDSADAAWTSSESVMLSMITDGTPSSGRLAKSAWLITIPSSINCIYPVWFLHNQEIALQTFSRRTLRTFRICC
jgi:hypothetical protein